MIFSYNVQKISEPTVLHVCFYLITHPNSYLVNKTGKKCTKIRQICRQEQTSDQWLWDISCVFSISGTVFLRNVVVLFFGYCISCWRLFSAIQKRPQFAEKLSYQFIVLFLLFLLFLLYLLYLLFTATRTASAAMHCKSTGRHTEYRENFSKILLLYVLKF